MVQMLESILVYNFFEIMRKDSLQTVFINPKWQIKPKLHRYPTKRWGHTAVVHKSKLYIYGGKTGKAKEPLYEIDCDTFQSHILESHGLPDSRESHSCSLIKEKLIIWGGCHNNKVLNDCLSFSVRNRVCQWSWIPQFPKLKQRESHATTVFKEKFILLYGGCNDQDIYEDIWVYNTELEIWFEIKSVSGKMKKRENCTLSVIKNTIFMFGGECSDETYENSLYSLKFSSFEFNSPQKVPQLFCQLINTKGKSPAPRSSHASVAYKDRFLIVIGGEGQGIVKGKQSTVLFNDVWAYDSMQNSWAQIDVANKVSFKPRSCFTASIYKNKIFIFGGLISIENFRSSDQLAVLSITDSVDRNIGICNICKLHYSPILIQSDKKDIVDVQLQNSFNFGLKNLFKLSKNIRNPFDALSLIFDGFNRMQYKKVTVDLIQQSILMIQGSQFYLGQKDFEVILKKYEFADQVAPQNSKIKQAVHDLILTQNLLIFGMNLKNACARLGNSFVFMNKRSSLIDIMLVTPENLFYSEVDVQDFSVGEKQSRSYEIIKNHLKNNNLNITLLSDETFTIAITDLRKISTNANELRCPNKYNIQLGIPNKMSFQQHVSTFFLDRPYTQFIINQKRVEFRSLQNQFREINEYSSLVPNDFQAIKIRQNSDVKEGIIFLYRNKTRIGKYQYKNESSPAVQGYVIIPSKYQLNIMRNKLEYIGQIQLLLGQICRQFSSSAGKRQPPVGLKQLENGAH